MQMVLNGENQGTSVIGSDLSASAAADHLAEGGWAAAPTQEDGGLLSS